MDTDVPYIADTSSNRVIGVHQVEDGFNFITRVVAQYQRHKLTQLSVHQLTWGQRKPERELKMNKLVYFYLQDRKLVPNQERKIFLCYIPK